MSATTAVQASAKLCQCCSDIIPINQTGHTTRPFYSTLADFLKQLRQCHLCTFLRDHLSDISMEGPSDQAFLYVRLKEPNCSEDEIQWALLEVSIQISIDGIEYNKIRTFSVTTCPLSCALHLCIRPC